MLNYIKADLHRILTRKPFLFCNLLLCALPIIIFFTFEQTDPWTPVNFLSMYEQIITYINILFGIITFFAIFSDDFKAKSMQVAIGRGLKRYQIVLSKLIQVAAVLFVSLFAFAIVSFVIALILGTGLQYYHALEIIGLLFSILLKCFSYISVCAIIVFFTQNVTLGLITYLFVCSGLFAQIVSMIFSIKAISAFHIERFLLTSMLNLFSTRLLLGQFDFALIIGIAIYIAAAFGITTALFNKHELEF